MIRVLIVECMQEISSFNPLPSCYGDYRIRLGDALLEQRGLNTGIGGALSVFDRRGDVVVVPVVSATAPSAGIVSADGWARLSAQIVKAVAARAHEVDAVYFSLHGAMGAIGELDPEGYLLSETRRLIGPDCPMVISLDLHGILTERMLAQVDGFAIYQTYPHVDFADTGRRAAKLLLRIIDENLRPETARVVIPALVRGDELVTKSGCYGDILRDAHRLEHEGRALATGVMIGNPFTDVPELCTQALICVERRNEDTEQYITEMSGTFWDQRHRMQGKLIALDKAIAQARTINGPVIFTDAADATSSGATGDSNVILKALMDAKYPKRVLLPIVDAAAAKAAASAGIGAEITVRLGGERDPLRFQPVPVTATVESLSRGRTQLETMRAPINAGLTAVLTTQNFTIVAISEPCFLFDRAVFYANGCDPQRYDLIVVKSPHTEYHMFDEWVVKNFNIDAPGSTSADLRSLGHRICMRPIYPLDPDVGFVPKVTWHQRRRSA
ncbi:MAG: M81 family metallopeptidase [Hyphomicrobiales bacterium]|nr:M81 family metallopeptidase [Hyphomicrobiales bacterium]